jgi:hypothetical protein
MKKIFAGSRDIYLRVLCVLAGAFVASLIPATKSVSQTHSGALAGLIAFELNHEVILLTMGVAWIVYWLLVKKPQGREPLIVFSALGWSVARLTVDLFHMAYR